MEVMIVVIGLLILAVAAWRWGFDSADGLDSPEWERRRGWRGFGPLAQHDRETTMEFAIDMLVAQADHAERVRQAEQAARIRQGLPLPTAGPVWRVRLTNAWRRWRGGLASPTTPEGASHAAR